MRALFRLAGQIGSEPIARFTLQHAGYHLDPRIRQDGQATA